MSAWLDTTAAARVFAQYAKRFHAGAFATPLAAELAVALQRGLLHTWHTEGDVLGLEQWAHTPHRVTDFTGERRVLPYGSRILRHLAPGGAPLPDLRAFHYVYAYVEDRPVIAQLRAQGFALHALHISAASELVGVYWQGPPTGYSAADQATLTEVPVDVPLKLRAQILTEVQALRGWRDDDPYYHKGEWSHLSLRGYKPTDPTWGVKPAEMSKAWHLAHPEAAHLRHCTWTSLAAQCPGLCTLIAAVPWWSRFERIRLLRLTQGQLRRHTDITDRTAGTRNGQISRFHLPLVTHPAVRTLAWDLQGAPLAMHWDAWRLYYLDQRKPHAVVNPSTVARLHLVVDVVTDALVRQHLAASYVGEEATCTRGG
jgi:hypothetical protein